MKQLDAWQQAGVDWMLGAVKQAVCEGDDTHTFIIADSMGSGKTALMAAYLSAVRRKRSEDDMMDLIICPNTLIHDWRDAIHAVSGKLPYVTTKDVPLPKDLKQGIVLAVRSIFSSSDANSTSILRQRQALLNKRWTNLIVDEARHSMGFFQSFKMTCSYTWALCGSTAGGKLPTQFGKLKSILRCPKERILARSHARQTGQPATALEVHARIETVELDFASDTERRLYQALASGTKLEQLRCRQFCAHPLVFERSIASRSVFGCRVRPAGGRRSTDTIPWCVDSERKSERTPGELSAPPVPLPEICQIADRTQDIIQQNSLLFEKCRARICTGSFIRGHPSQGDAHLTCSKFEAIVHFIIHAAHAGSKFVIFCTWLHEVDLYVQCLRSLGIYTDCLNAHGDPIVAAGRISNFTNLKQSGGAVFVLTMRTGIQGINLTDVDYIFLTSPQLDTFNEYQAFARAVGRRGGATSKQVRILRYLIRNTIEDTQGSGRNCHEL